MKRIVLTVLIVLVLLGMTATAFAKTKKTSSSSDSSAPEGLEVDASLVLATAPASGFDTGIGVNIGAGMMLPQIDKNLQGRVEISYLTWSASELGFNLTYTRIPIDFAGRYYIPTQASNLKVYVQAGLELSYDKAEAAVPIFGKTSSTETNLGIVPGAGIDVKINKNLSFVADLRAHIIDDSYLTIQGGVAYHF
jgi:hypothetical protein